MSLPILLESERGHIRGSDGAGMENYFKIVPKQEVWIWMTGRRRSPDRPLMERERQLGGQWDGLRRR